MLYRFQIELSDVDRDIYETLDLRTAQHPSEAPAYLLTRVLAYALSFTPGLEFTPGGLADPDAPALKATALHGAVDLWIEIGNPSARKLHRASKSAQRVEVYTYKNPQLLIEQIKPGEVHRASEIAITAFAPEFVRELENQLDKNNRWTLLRQEDRLDLETAQGNLSTDLIRLSLS